MRKKTGSNDFDYAETMSDDFLRPTMSIEVNFSRNDGSSAVTLSPIDLSMPILDTPVIHCSTMETVDLVRRRPTAGTTNRNKLKAKPRILKEICDQVRSAAVDHNFLSSYDAALRLVCSDSLDMQAICRPFDIFLKDGKDCSWSICWGFSHRTDKGELDLQHALFGEASNGYLGLDHESQPSESPTLNMPFDTLFTGSPDFLFSPNDLAVDPMFSPAAGAPPLKVESPHDVQSDMMSQGNGSENVNVHRLHQFYAVKRHPRCPRFAISLDKRKWWNRNICQYCKYSFFKRSVRTIPDRLGAASLNYSQLCFDELVMYHNRLMLSKI